nr:MAG TPA: hemolysin [Caudoviricetes sp.]
MSIRRGILNEKEITIEFVERMAKMESKLDMLIDMLPEITALQIAQARSEQTAASAHNRIDNIYKVAGLISTIISVVIALIGRAV